MKLCGEEIWLWIQTIWMLDGRSEGEQNKKFLKSMVNVIQTEIFIFNIYLIEGLMQELLMTMFCWMTSQAAKNLCGTYRVQVNIWHQVSTANADVWQLHGNKNGQNQNQGQALAYTNKQKYILVFYSLRAYEFEKNILLSSPVFARPCGFSACRLLFLLVSWRKTGALRCDSVFHTRNNPGEPSIKLWNVATLLESGHLSLRNVSSWLTRIPF